MNYLQLCQRAARECGLSSAGPSSVTSQVGELADVVDRVADSWAEIQRSKTQWSFLWTSTSKDLLTGGQEYSPSADWGLSVRAWDRNRFRIYLSSGSTAEEQRVEFIPWEEFVLSYGIGVHSPSIPSVYTIRPDGKIVFPGALDADYTLRMEYWANPVILENNTDTPVIDTDFHMAIVWRTVMTYGAHEEAVTKRELARAEYQRIYSDMCRRYLPDITFGDPIGA